MIPISCFKHRSFDMFPPCGAPAALLRFSCGAPAVLLRCSCGALLTEKAGPGNKSNIQKRLYKNIYLSIVAKPYAKTLSSVL